MAIPKVILIKESKEELRRILKKSKPIIIPRIRMLLEMKKYEKEGVSKRQLAELIGVNHNSIQNWRTIYINGGIELLCSHKKTGFRPSVINKTEHEAIKNKLNDPLNGLRGYKELMKWVEEEFHKEIKYNTLLKYCMRKFGSKSKVARKSHLKKDEKAVEAFKKTSHRSASRP